MKIHLFTLLAIATFLMASGCKRESGPPPPLSVEQMGPEFKKVFADASQATRAASAEVVSALQVSNYVAAFGASQALCARTDMTPEQQVTASRALLTVNRLLQDAQAHGDKAAAELIQMHKSNR